MQQAECVVLATTVQYDCSALLSEVLATVATTSTSTVVMTVTSTTVRYYSIV